MHIRHVILHSHETVFLLLTDGALVDLFLRSTLALTLDDNLVLLEELIHVAAQFVAELV